MKRLLGGALLGLLLAATAATPAWADKISGADKNPLPSSATEAASAADIDFGDDTSDWANDGECDDPRFTGDGTAEELIDDDIGKDATDCKAALEAGTIQLREEATGPAAVEIATPVNAIDWGDDSSEWANDGECDDPRFKGEGTAEELSDADISKDATDCRAAFEAGTISLVDQTAQDTEAGDVATADIDFGDDSGEWANDGECDDPRFRGEGSATELLETDVLKDATDCQAALEAGTVEYTGDTGSTFVGDDAIDYGDDASEWANDGECDDPRFEGEGVATEVLPEDRGHDATDCKAAVEAGTASYIGEDAPQSSAASLTFDYGGDWSTYANDGECDDLRFEGEGTDKKLLSEDQGGDATDCKMLEEEGRVSIRTVFTPEYAAGAPYDSSDIDFGDNSSSYADDDLCDDPRFEGPGAASVLLDSDESHDANDCKAAYEAGTVMLIETVETE